MVKHGCARDRLYTIWNGVVQRCLNPKHPQYDSYGGRGITVHESWLPPATEGYLKFREDVLAIAKEQGLGSAQIEWLEGKSGGAKSGEGFGQGAKQSELPVKLTLDRKDNEEGYNPGNCRWVGYATQNRNRRAGKLGRNLPKGVTWREHRGKFQACVMVDRKYISLGYYLTAEEAGQARQLWQLENDLSPE